LEEALNEVLGKGGVFCFGYAVPGPERFGVVEFDASGRVLSIIDTSTWVFSGWKVLIN
jgi:glucose-1-phosphate thymidylyltransferase